MSTARHRGHARQSEYGSYRGGIRALQAEDEMQRQDQRKFGIAQRHIAKTGHGIVTMPENGKGGWVAEKITAGFFHLLIFTIIVVGAVQGLAQVGAQEYHHAKDFGVFTSIIIFVIGISWLGYGAFLWGSGAPPVPYVFAKRGEKMATGASLIRLRPAKEGREGSHLLSTWWSMTVLVAVMLLSAIALAKDYNKGSIWKTTKLENLKEYTDADKYADSVKWLRVTATATLMGFCALVAFHIYVPLSTYWERLTGGTDRPWDASGTWSPKKGGKPIFIVVLYCLCALYGLWATLKSFLLAIHEWERFYIRTIFLIDLIALLILFVVQGAVYSYAIDTPIFAMSYQHAAHYRRTMAWTMIMGLLMYLYYYVRIGADPQGADVWDATKPVNSMTNSLKARWYFMNAILFVVSALFTLSASATAGLFYYNEILLTPESAAAAQKSLPVIMVKYPEDTARMLRFLGGALTAFLIYVTLVFVRDFGFLLGGWQKMPFMTWAILDTIFIGLTGLVTLSILIWYAWKGTYTTETNERKAVYKLFGADRAALLNAFMATLIIMFSFIYTSFNLDYGDYPQSHKITAVDKVVPKADQPNIGGQKEINAWVMVYATLTLRVGVVLLTNPALWRALTFAIRAYLVYREQEVESDTARELQSALAPPMNARVGTVTKDTKAGSDSGLVADEQSTDFSGRA